VAEVITSRQNSEFKALLKLHSRKHRQQQKAFLAEGLRLVEDGVAAGWRPLKLVISPPLLSPGAMEKVGQWDFPRLELAPDLMAQAGDTETSQGIMAIFPLPARGLKDIEGDLVLILDGIRDPGNAGTLLRSAAAAGVNGVLAVSGTVDLSSPKVVRASMGGIFRVPWVANLAASELLQWVEAEEYRLIGMEPRGGTPFHRYDYSGKLALVVGSEAHGVSPEIAGACAHSLTIPMPGGQESLNAAMAATLVLYQAIIHKGL
jgi:TrmH family RNA methyltransferase